MPPAPTAIGKQPVTDTVMTTKVKAELAKEGSVASMAEEQTAEVDARAVKGVVSVDNNLKMASAAP